MQPAALELAHVTRAEPAVLDERVARRRIVVEIATEDAGPSPGSRRRRDSQLHVVECPARRVEPSLVQAVAGENRRRLGETVALHHSNAHPLPRRRDVDRNGRAAGHHDAQAPPSCEWTLWKRTCEAQTADGRQSLRPLEQPGPPVFLGNLLNSLEHENKKLRIARMTLI